MTTNRNHNESIPNQEIMHRFGFKFTSMIYEVVKCYVDYKSTVYAAKLADGRLTYRSADIDSQHEDLMIQMLLYETVK